jgi:GNAT superfamily N-acetyltransferase
MEIQRVDYSTLQYVDSLRKKESDALGFVPLQAYERAIEGVGGYNLLLCMENGDPVGFVYSSHNRAGITKIIQVVVQEDARRKERASALVEAVQNNNDWLMSLRVASDLDSVNFWEALGFELARKEPRRALRTLPDNQLRDAQHKPGREILRFQKVVGGLWMPNNELVIAEGKQ